MKHPPAHSSAAPVVLVLSEKSALAISQNAKMRTTSNPVCSVALTLLAMLFIVQHEAKSAFAFVVPPAPASILQKGAQSLNHSFFLETAQAFRPTTPRYPFNNSYSAGAPVHATRNQKKPGHVAGFLERLRLHKRMRALLRKIKWVTKVKIKTEKIKQPVNSDVVRTVQPSTGESDNVDGFTEIPEKHHNPQRWAVASKETDLSGVWKPVVTPRFREEYDEYLRRCGKGVIFRRAMLGAVGLLKEVVEQKDRGRELSITGTTTIGRWKRTLIASGYERDVDEELSSSEGRTLFEPVYSTFQDPDGDMVSVESWWEDNGRVHKSWLRGKPRVLGGEFESTRYLEGDSDDVLVCESVFHPPPIYDSNRFQPASMEWRFQRE